MISTPPTFPCSQVCELRFRYTNHKLETEQRRATPIRIWYGSSSFHQGPQWFMEAMDLDKGETRNFALRDMSEVTQHGQCPGQYIVT